VKLLKPTKRQPKKRIGRARPGEGSLQSKGGRYYYRIADPEHPGKQIQRACGTSDLQEAIAIKNRALLALAESQPLPVPTPTPAELTIGDLLSQYLAKQKKKAEYREQGDPDFNADRAISSVRTSVNRLNGYFGKLPARELTSARLEDYREQRENRDRVLFTTVNHEFRYLRAALRLAARQTPPLITHVPAMWIPSEESRVREGFIRREEHYEPIYHALPDSLKCLFVVSFHTGARSGELRKMRWDMINFETERIEIRAKTAKNKTGRWMPIWGDMEAALREQKSVHDKYCPHSPWVFFLHPGEAGNGNYLLGSQLGPIDAKWRKAVASIGLKGFIFHDLRRSAIIYAIDSGLPPELVMMMSGHKTDEVSGRYNIRGTRDIDRMGAVLNAYLQKTGGKRVLHLVPEKSKKSA
jgi:integrase